MADTSIFIHFDPSGLRDKLLEKGHSPDRIDSIVQGAIRLARHFLPTELSDTDKTVQLPLNSDELHALHTLLHAAHLDPGSGSIFGSCIKDWRDYLDILHQKLSALAETHHDPAVFHPPTSS